MVDKLEKKVFISFVLSTAIAAFLLQVFSKTLAQHYDKFTLVAVTQLIAFVLATFVVLAYLGGSATAKEIARIAPKHWLYILLSAIVALVAFLLSLHTLKTEDISDHGILDTAASILIAMVGGYLVFGEGASIRRILAIVVMIAAAVYAVHN